MADIFDTYVPADAWDEMFARPGVCVAPLKGIYHGAPSSTLDITVEVTRLA